MIRKISGKPTGIKIPHLRVNNSEVTDIPDIAKSLAQTFSDNSSSEQYSAKFQSFRRQAENNPLNFKSNNTETYNNLFSMSELTTAISKSRVVNTWNSLPNWVVSAYTTDTFKARLDKFWHSIVYDFRAQLQGTGSRSEVLCEKF